MSREKEYSANLKTPLVGPAGFKMHGIVTLVLSSLGSFKRVDFRLCCGSGRGYMCCQIAFAAFPFYHRLRIDRTIPSGFIRCTFVAAVTLLHDLMANPAIVTAAFYTHKCTFQTFADRYTNHLNHPLSTWFLAGALRIIFKNKHLHRKTLFYYRHAKILKKAGDLSPRL